MSNGTKKSIVRYEAVIKGVFGRNRKAKVEFVRLKDTEPGDPLHVDQAMALGKLAAEKIKLKPGGTVRVQTRNVELESHIGSDGTAWISELTTLFGETVIGTFTV